jgi:hypothetical protein
VLGAELDPALIDVYKTASAVLERGRFPVVGSPHDVLWISAFKTYPLAFSFSTEVQNPNYRLHGVIDLTQAVTTDTSRALYGAGRNEAYRRQQLARTVRNGAIVTGDNGSVTTIPYQNKRRRR